MSIDDILSQQRAERDELGGALMKALRDALPWGLKVGLGHGRTAELVPMNGNPSASQPKRMPIYPPGDHPPAIGEGPEPIGFHEWSVSFDWKLANCDQDHIEITAKITGGGGAV